MNSPLVRHALVIAVLAVLLGIGMVLPFLPGRYDPLAFTISFSAQVIGVVGLLFVPPGAAWLVYEGVARPHARKRHVFAVAAIAVGCLAAGLLGPAAAIAGSISFGVFVLAASAYSALRLLRRVLRARGVADETISAAPIYLVVVPLAALVLQLALAAPATEFSRNRAIAASAEIIGDIEAYCAEHGAYPETMLGMHPDYRPSVIGIERFEYARRGDTYDLCFEQPRFLLDDLGTREVLVYNPRDEHVIMSHAAWNLVWAPGEEDVQQGWFSVHEMDTPHWKSFSFD